MGVGFSGLDRLGWGIRIGIRILDLKVLRDI